MGYRLPALAGLLALAALALAHNLPHLAPGLRNWAEPGNVAAALVEGRGFSDPFGGGTGATAWVSPLPVWIEAVVFAAVGVQSAAAAGVLLVLSWLGLAGALAFALAAVAPFGRVGVFATAAAFILYAAVIPGNPLEVLSEAWLDLLLSAVLLWALLALDGRGARGAAPALIAVAGLAPLDNAGLTAATGLALLLLLWRGRRQPGTRRLVGLACLALLAVTAGWTLRNRAALGRFVPLKSNSWFELHLANVDSADGRPRMETVLRRLPFFSAGEFARYRDAGEIAYVESFRAPALAAIAADPGHFLGNIARRFALSAVLCRREGGGAPTDFAFSPPDLLRLARAQEVISFGPNRNLWTRIDRPVAEEQATLHRLGLAAEGPVFRDWAERRVAYDAENNSLAAVALAFFTAGLPVLGFLLCVLLARGPVGGPARWAGLLALGLILPYVLVNNNERHQLPLFALQAVLLGAAAQALRDRGGRAAAPA